MTLTIVCPRCTRASSNPNDVREGYCGACHAWTGRVGEVVTNPLTEEVVARRCPCGCLWVDVAETACPVCTVRAPIRVAEMARELHALIRNGKEFPYADGEEKRYYELIVTRWLDALEQR